MKKINFLLIIILGVVLFSCEANTTSEVSAPTPPKTATENPNPDSSKITYTKDVQPIISSNCLGCHGVTGNTPTMTTFTQVKNAASTGKLLCSIQALGCKVMPTTGKMPQATIDKILLWASQGYIE